MHNCVIFGLFVNLADPFRAEVLAPAMSIHEAGLLSPAYPFPVHGATRDDPQEAFAALYPLLEASMAIAHAEPHHLPERLEFYRQWYCRTLDKAPATEVHDDASTAPITLSELDHYHMICAGTW